MAYVICIIAAATGTRVSSQYVLLICTSVVFLHIKKMNLDFYGFYFLPILPTQILYNSIWDHHFFT